jgi:hypothetical protein
MSNPRNDRTFKQIFHEHPQSLIDLLNAFLPLDVPIEAIEYMPQELQAEVGGFYMSLVDVRCRDKLGRHFIVEMQMQRTDVNVFKSGSSCVTNTGTYTNPERIESGMAFFVEPETALASATNITISESHKATAAAAGMPPFGTAPSDEHGRMFIRLETLDSSGSRQVIDGVLADFHSSFSSSLGDMSDREKMRNTISHGAM